MIIITTYEQLNKLIAQSLGWEERSISVFGLTAKIFCPTGIKLEEAFEYHHKYSGCPDFATNWQDIEDLILSECDRQNIFVEWTHSPEIISCTMRQIEHKQWSSADFKSVITGGKTKLPRSMSLATSLTWLTFKENKVNIDILSN